MDLNHQPLGYEFNTSFWLFRSVRISQQLSNDWFDPFRYVFDAYISIKVGQIRLTNVTCRHSASRGVARGSGAPVSTSLDLYSGRYLGASRRPHLRTQSALGSG